MQCGGCGLNFQELALRLDVRSLIIDDQAVRLHCPACGRPNSLDLRSLNILHRGDRFYRWRAAPGAVMRGEYVVEFGRLALAFPEDRVEALTLERMCYPSVPVFRNQDGSWSYPRLPVRKEFVDFIDMTRTRLPDVNVERRLYRIELAFRGLDLVERVERPLLTPKSGGPVWEGAHLIFWPDIPYVPWRHYFVRFGFAPERADMYRGDREVWVYARALEPRENPQVSWVRLKTLPSGAQVASLMSRPDWLALEWVSPTLGEVVGGGLWQVEPSTVRDYPNVTLTVAVDFGTSNTYMAYQIEPERTRFPLELRDCSRYLIAGSQVPAVLNSPEPWFPAKGFNPAGATLPSEIVTVESLERLRGGQSALESWKPIEDYGILGAGVKVEYPDRNHTIAEFKWQETVSPDFLRGQYQQLQAKYLYLLLLIALANLARQDRVGRNTLETRFSYPLSFSEDMKEAFQKVLNRVQESLKESTGLPVLCTLSLDEARAASYSIGQLSPQYHAYLFVDVGGGSADVSLMIYSESREAFVTIDSVRYAGGALVSAFSRGGCLQTGITADEFRRYIRETGNLTELQRMGTVFDERRRPIVVRKTEYFYGYLREYLARILAAHFVNGEWQQYREEAEVQHIDSYRIALYPLGNGWGFGALLSPKYIDWLAKELKQRTEGILQEVLGTRRGDYPRLEIVPQPLPGDTHPKQAVALGLLEKPAGRERREVPLGVSFRTILGWTVQVGVTRQIPWHRTTDESLFPPEGEEAIPSGSILDCPRDTTPRFPKDLDDPYEIDRDLNRTRGILNQECLQGHRWFRRTPLQVMMESLFKPHLERVV